MANLLSGLESIPLAFLQAPAPDRDKVRYGNGESGFGCSCGKVNPDDGESRILISNSPHAPARFFLPHLPLARGNWDLRQENAMSEENLSFMQLAVDEGKKSRAEDNQPHPKVGAAIAKDGKLLGLAHRGELGTGDHGEYTLLGRKLSDVDLKGTTLFTTLEPCTARKKHKPCSDWIIEKGIKTVIIGMLDPNPKICNHGAYKLRKAGINVHYFPLELRNEILADNADFIRQFEANPQAHGTADFDYTNNDGKFVIGNGDYLFETRWSKGSDTRIHLYKDRTNLKGVAIAVNAQGLADITDASIFNMSSRVRTIAEGELAVVENLKGYYAALMIMDVKDKSRSDPQDELVFEYWILTDKGRDFSKL